MEYEISHRPAYALLTVDLERGESVVAEPGAMVSHSAGITVETETGTGGDSGLLGSVANAVLGGESLTHNRFTADRAGHVSLTSRLPGDIAALDVGGAGGGDGIHASSGAFVASGPDVAIDTDVGGLDTFFADEGLFVLRLEGSGPAFLSAFGGLETVEVTGGEPYTVDTGHVVAWDAALEFDVTRVGGLKTTAFSDEGLVCEFSGDGRVWLQTRNFEDFVSHLAEHLPTGGGGGSRHVHHDHAGDEGIEEEGGFDAGFEGGGGGGEVE